MTTELCVAVGRGANRLHRVTCPRPRVRYPLAMVAPATVLGAVPAKCCKPHRDDVIRTRWQYGWAPQIDATVDRCMAAS